MFLFIILIGNRQMSRLCETNYINNIKARKQNLMIVDARDRHLSHRHATI